MERKRALAQMLKDKGLMMAVSTHERLTFHFDILMDKLLVLLKVFVFRFGLTKGLLVRIIIVYVFSLDFLSKSKVYCPCSLGCVITRCHHGCLMSFVKRQSDKTLKRRISYRHGSVSMLTSYVKADLLLLTDPN